jgi:hypothetical protein
MSARPTIGPTTAPAIQALDLEPPLLLLSLDVVSDPKPVEAGCGMDSANVVLAGASHCGGKWLEDLRALEET